MSKGAKPPRSSANTHQCLLLIFDTLTVSLHNILKLDNLIPHTRRTRGTPPYWIPPSGCERCCKIRLSCQLCGRRFAFSEMAVGWSLISDIRCPHYSECNRAFVVCCRDRRPSFVPQFLFSTWIHIKRLHLRLIPHSSVLMNISFHL